jgi:hypothetical protein
MSKVKIQGNASGTGIFTVAAPATNTDRTLTLPDVDATVLTTAGGAISGAGTGTFGVYNDPLTIEGSDYTYLHLKGHYDQAGIIYSKDSSTGWFQGIESSSFRMKIAPMASINQTGLTNAKDGTAGLYIDSSGRVTIPSQPCFHAGKYDDGGQIAAGVYVFPSVDVNVGGYYNSSNGRFTAPIAGNYYFATTLQLYGSTATTADVRFYKNGSAYLSNSYESYGQTPSSSSHQTIPHIAVIPLAAGDYVTVYRTQTTRGMQSHFCGWLIG